jgi:hypothetical protein
MLISVLLRVIFGGKHFLLGRQEYKKFRERGESDSKAAITSVCTVLLGRWCGAPTDSYLTLRWGMRSDVW